MQIADFSHFSFPIKGGILIASTFSVRLSVILVKEVLLQVIWFVVAEPENYVFQPRSLWLSVLADFV